MCLDDGLGDRQSEAQALRIVRRGVAAPAEPFENPFELFGRDADPAIGDTNPDLAISARYIDFYLALGI